MLRVKFQNLRKELYDGLWRQAASNVGADFENWRGGYVRFQRDGLTTFALLTRVNLNSHLLERVLLDKEMTQETLRQKGCAVPAHIGISSAEVDRGVAFFEKLGKSVVVKPASGTGGGRGVTTNIRDVVALKQAVRTATMYSNKVLIEEYVQGSCFRLLYLGGELIDAVRRDSPQLNGDGVSTIRQLIKAENQRRLKERPISSLMPLVADQDCRNTLAWQGLSLSSVPGAGQTLTVKTAVNENNAWQNTNVKDRVHPEIVEAGRKLLDDLGITLGGLDLQTDDISVPMSVSGAKILEVNSPPGIHHHYIIDAPERGTPIAELLLDYMFTRRQGVMDLS